MSLYVSSLGSNSKWKCKYAICPNTLWPAVQTVHMRERQLAAR